LGIRGGINKITGAGLPGSSTAQEVQGRAADCTKVLALELVGLFGNIEIWERQKLLN
jgi:hypothetical protein